MKRILFSVLTLAAMTGGAQQDKQTIEQTGTPAVMTVKDRKVKAFLQRMEGDKITFQPFKQARDITVPADKITSIQYVDKYDEEAFKTAFESADYAAALAIIEPIMKDIAQYMSIESNMREPFTMMFESYWGQGDFANVTKHADMMMSFGEQEKEATEVALAMGKIDAGDYAGAKAIEESLENEAAKLYLQAVALRAQNDPEQAIRTSTMIIHDHVYDLEWLPRAELLNAYLYLEMAGTNSLINTNSAIVTGRMTKNMNKGNNVAGEARIFWADLGGEAIEEADKADRAKRAAVEKKRKEDASAKRKKDAAERKARQAEEKRRKEAEKEAAAAAAADPGVDTTTETESE